MKLRELPGFSDLYTDFVEGAPSIQKFLARPAGLDSVIARAVDQRGRKLPRAEVARCFALQNATQKPGGKTGEQLDALSRAETVVVLAECGPGLAGGSLSNLLKLLTAVKLAGEVSASGTPAVPVCLLAGNVEEGASAKSIFLLDSESHLRAISVSPAATAGVIDPEFRERVISAIADVLGVAVPMEVSQLLRDAYEPGISIALANARFLARLLEEWGVLCLDPSNPEFRSIAERNPVVGDGEVPALLKKLKRRKAELDRVGYQSGKDFSPDLEKHVASAIRTLALASTLPVACSVVDQADLYDLALAGAVYSESGPEAPVLWPRASATVIEGRSRKILERYGIAFESLFDPEGLKPETPTESATIDETVAGLDGLVDRIETTLKAVRNSAPAGGTLTAAVEESGKKMLFQTGKLKERFIAARQSRREVMHRQLERVRNTLVPGGALQEAGLSCIHFVLRYSTGFPRTLFERLDILQRDHQLLSVE